MFSFLYIKKLLLIFFTIILTMLAYIVIVTFVVKININSSFSSLNPQINFSFYNPVKNNLYISGFKLKDDESKYISSEINFRSINIFFNGSIFSKKNIYLKDLILSNGLIEIIQKKETRENNTVHDKILLRKIKTNKKTNLNKKIIIENLFIDTDLKFIDKNFNEYFLYLACSGKNVSNFKKGSLQLVGSSYDNNNEFNTKLNIEYPANNLVKSEFSVTGSIENIPSSLLNNFLNKVKLQYESLSLDSYIFYKDNDFDDSKVIIRLNNVDVNYENYNTYMSKFQFPIYISGSIKSPKTNFSEGLNLLKQKTVENFAQILGNKFQEEYDRIEDQAKDELRKLDDNLGISELDEKIKEEYDRIENQAKDELRKLDDNLGISELDEKIEKNINLFKNKVFKKINEF